VILNLPETTFLHLADQAKSELSILTIAATPRVGSRHHVPSRPRQCRFATSRPLRGRYPC